MKKRYLIVPIVALCITSNVYAITSNDVMYDNDGTTENLTTTLDNLYSELKKYKTGGSVQSNQMLEGATGYSKGELVTGTIKSKAATTYTPGTSNQTIDAGVYLSGAQTIKGDANLTAANIAKGKSIFGVSGTYTSDANATAANILSGKTAYVNGSKITGTIIDRTNDAGITGLSNAYSPTKLEMNGNQLRLAINPGYYGSSNYSSFGTPGVVVDNLFTMKYSMYHETIPGTNETTDLWTSAGVEAGTYLVVFASVGTNVRQIRMSTNTIWCGTDPGCGWIKPTFLGHALYAEKVSVDTWLMTVSNTTTNSNPFIGAVDNNGNRGHFYIVSNWFKIG